MRLPLPHMSRTKWILLAVVILVGLFFTGTLRIESFTVGQDAPASACTPACSGGKKCKYTSTSGTGSPSCQ